VHKLYISSNKWHCKLWYRLVIVESSVHTPLYNKTTNTLVPMEHTILHRTPFSIWQRFLILIIYLHTTKTFQNYQNLLGFLFSKVPNWKFRSQYSSFLFFMIRTCKLIDTTTRGYFKVFSSWSFHTQSASLFVTGPSAFVNIPPTFTALPPCGEFVWGTSLAFLHTHSIFRLMWTFRRKKSWDNLKVLCQEI